MGLGLGLGLGLRDRVSVHFSLFSHTVSVHGFGNTVKIQPFVSPKFKKKLQKKIIIIIIHH